MRNNQERTGAPPSPEVPANAIDVPNPSTPGGGDGSGGGGTGLNFVVPTEFVDLPSKGEFYSENHPLHGQDVVEVRHMTAKEEDILTSRTLLKKGLAIDRLIQNILVNKKLKVEDILVGDKNAILVHSRIAAYGAQYNTNVTCPNCYTQQKYNFNLLESKVVHPDDIEEPQFQRTDGPTFTTILPKTKVQAEMRLLTGADEAWLVKLSERKKKTKLGSDSTLSDQMKLFLVSLNGVRDKGQIHKFVDLMPAADSRYLRKVYGEISPNLDLTQEFSCSACDTEIDMEVPFTAEFFWPKQ